MAGPGEISKLYLHLGLELGQVRVQFSDMLVNQLVGVDSDVDLVIRDLLRLLEHSLQWTIRYQEYKTYIKYCNVEPPGRN